MMSRFLIFALLFPIALVGYTNCSQSGFNVDTPLAGSISSGSTAPLPISGSESNVIKVSVGCGYINQPCVSVQICEPGTSNCQTINNVLLDTGSYGLRVFSSVVNLNLPQKTINDGNLAECVSYADGTSNWGPVKGADVVLGGLRASSIPIQVIDIGFSSVPNDCMNPETSPTEARYNGILGVGLFTEDCGIGCATVQNNRMYFSCIGNTCSSTAVPIPQQVSNPVAFLPSHNNGVILQMPSIPSAGSTSAFGYMILGIGTQANNTPTTANVFPTNSAGHFQTIFNGNTYTSAFIDSGSNGYFFPIPSSLPACAMGSAAQGFFCPSNKQSFTAIQAGAPGNPRVSVDFEITNAVAAVTGPNFMFNNIGGNFSGAFAWGMPFYFGRTVFHGIEGKASPLGVGPYWAW